MSPSDDGHDSASTPMTSPATAYSRSSSATSASLSPAGRPAPPLASIRHLLRPLSFASHDPRRPRPPHPEPAPDHRRYASDAAPSDAAKPRTRNVLRRRPSAKLLKGRDRGMSSPVPDTPPLTPAGAVVEAYKQQKRSKLSMDTPSPSPYRGHAPSPLQHRHDLDDRSSSLFDPDQRSHTASRVTLSHQPSASDPSSRLTRKVSSRWQKIASAPPLQDAPKGHAKGRPSLQEMWSMRSKGRSIDASDTCWPSPIQDHPRPESENDNRKLWRLMRRISTGGLRDRFQSEKAVPPVPAIPKELLEKSEPIPRLSSRDGAAKILSVSVPTPSFSSNSSDVASTRFFHQTHSSRSSVSSYGEARPLHIMAPMDQLRLGEDSAGPVSRSPLRSASVPTPTRKAEDSDEYAPLPSPRHHSSSRNSPSIASLRLDSPSASGNPHASYQGTRQSRMADGTVPLSPPPKPTRSSHRGGSTTSLASHSPSHRQVNDRTPSSRSDMTARPESPDAGRPSSERAQLTFRELGAPRRPPLSEREKMDIWNDLLERSDRAGGTLHINGATELMSDSIRFSIHSET